MRVPFSRRRSPWTEPSGERRQAGSLAVRLLGGEGSPIVLLHGLVGSGLYWGGHYDRLAEGHRLVVPDLLGFGGSARPDTGYGPDDHAQAVIECLDSLGVHAPVVIGAHSLGTLIGLRLAARFPHRVRALVGFGPPLYPDTATAGRLAARTGAMARLFVSSPFAHIVCRWVCRHRGVAARVSMWTHPYLPGVLAADGVRHSWASYSMTLEQVILAAEAYTWFDDIDVPVRLVAGDTDRAVDPAFLESLAARHHNVELESWPGGHNLPLAYPDRCAALIEAVANTASAD